MEQKRNYNNSKPKGRTNTNKKSQNNQKPIKVLYSEIKDLKSKKIPKM